MKGIFTIAIIILVYSPIFAQWDENFDDGDFSSNPAWVGDVDEFVIDSGLLRLNAPAQTGSSYLATSSTISLEASWSFFLRLDFNPSSANYAKVYIMADEEDLGNVKNGYFVKIGGSADEISLFKIIGGTETLLIDGVDGRVSLSSVEVEIQISRDLSHTWQLKSKLNGEPSFALEGNAVDADLGSASFFGIYCKYTSTRSTKFYLDDILVTGSSFIDNDAPEVLSYSTPIRRQILLSFNEALDSTEVKQKAQFLLNDSVEASSISILTNDSLLLNFNTDLSLINTLHLTSVTDLAGNSLDSLLQIFFVDTAAYQFRDLVINEIFADPSPPEDLPPFEFVELLNNSDRVIQVEGWQFTDGSKMGILGSTLLLPDSFLLICPMEALEDYKVFGATQGLPTWPTLNNGGDNLQLISPQGAFIDSVAYKSNWYKDSSKDEGGWSLEQINPSSVCTGIFNWAAAKNLTGGTPGKRNSLFSNTDSLPPHITQALVTDILLEVWLSEPLAVGQFQGEVTNINEPVNFVVETPSSFLSTEFEQDLALNKLTEISLPLQDCNGNNGISTAALVPIASPVKGDIIINELLFNPYGGGADFVELYNKTDYYFNLKKYQMLNESASDLLTETTYILKPNHYLALSEDIVFLKNEYLAPDSALFKTDLPTMPNDKGIIVIKSNKGITLDSVFYSEDFHFTLINDVEGISLERISETQNSLDPNNWRSAAESTGFATPGYTNAQSSEATMEGEITVSPEVITPNNDGQADFCQISYALDGQSQAITIRVYNLQGQQVKSLASNAIIPPSGFFIWDGTNQTGGVLPTAHYIIITEVISASGQVLTFKNKVVVANDF